MGAPVASARRLAATAAAALRSSVAAAACGSTVTFGCCQFKIALARFPFLGDFDGKLISGEERLIKPDPRFFQLLIDRYGVVPSRAIFIDDLAKNTSVAEGMGFRTHHFENPAKLRHHLEELNVIAN